MNDRDSFAVWLAAALLRQQDDDLGAATLQSIALQADSSAELDSGLSKATAHEARPGDFGVEFLGPFIPIILVEFGRILWDAYSKALLAEGGKKAATLTIDKVKQLAKRMWSHSQATVVTLDEAEARLRNVAQQQGLNSEQIGALVSSLRSSDLLDELRGG